MVYYSSEIFVLHLLAANGVYLLSNDEVPCEVRARIDSGWICGLRRLADDGSEYASFRGIPYAKQPLGVLRFQELRPVAPWEHYLDATEEGKICPQHDEVYERLMKPLRGTSEACMYANVHVPNFANYIDPYYETNRKSGLPVLVYIHGGGFQAGSGDADLNGPEYLVSQGVIVITFNYRLNVFGFLSLNSPLIPGNQGLRDQVTLLRWVQRNARAFGGDPDNVTLMGQSAGAVCAHLLSLSKATEGLFRRVILLSGAGNTPFYTASPLFAQMAATMFLTKLGINSTDPVSIHDQLVKMPLERILIANSDIQYALFLISFSPVVEAPYPGVTRIIDDDPIELIKRGRGIQYPTMIGFTSSECELFRPRIIYLETLKRIEANPTAILGPMLLFKTPPNVSLQLAKRVIERYFKGTLNYDDFMISCSESFFMYPAFRLADQRTAMEGEPVYLYQYDYESESGLMKNARYLEYRGSVHVEDFIQIFRPNAILGPQTLPLRDSLIVDTMRTFVANFMKCSNPSCVSNEATSPWPAVHRDLLNYQLVTEPRVYINRGPTLYEWNMIRFFDRIYADAKRGASESSVTDGPEAAAMLRNTTDQALLMIRPPYNISITYKYKPIPII